LKQWWVKRQVSLGETRKREPEREVGAKKKKKKPRNKETRKRTDKQVGTEELPNEGGEVSGAREMGKAAT